MSPEVTNGLFALGGAVLAALISGAFIWAQTKRWGVRPELSIFIERSAHLIAVDSSISDLVEIRVQGVPVPTVYTSDTRIVNTGTVPLKSGEIDFAMSNDADLIVVNVVEFPDGAADAITLEPNDDSQGYRARFQYINPGEEFHLRALMTAIPSQIQPRFRQPGVVTRIRKNQEPTLPGLLANVLFEIIRNNWLLHFYFKHAVPQYQRYLEQLDRKRT